MNILIAGATGFIGNQLVLKLLEQNHRILVLTRDLNRARDRITFENKNLKFIDYKTGWKDETFDVIINLAGSPIASRTWNRKQKKRIINSRLLSTDYIYIQCLQNKIKPKLWITVSGTGYYGNCGSVELTENTVVTTSSYLQQVAQHIENNSKKIANIVERHCIVRIGNVLAQNHGLLGKIEKIYKWNLGGKIGDGFQYCPWISNDDIISSFLFLINNESCKGLYNLCAPNSCTNAEFSKTLAKELHKKEFFTIPKFLIKLLYGKRAELILSSQRIYPQHLLDDGYKFKHEFIEEALHSIYHRDD